MGSLLLLCVTFGRSVRRPSVSDRIVKSNMPIQNKNRPTYDLPTAVTFLLGGLALGWMLTLLLSPLSVRSSRPWTASKPLPAADEVFE